MFLGRTARSDFVLGTFACAMEEFRAEGGSMLAKGDQFVLRQNRLQTFLTLDERKGA